MSAPTMAQARGRDSVTAFPHPQFTRKVGVWLLALAVLAAFVGPVGAQPQQKDEVQRVQEALEQARRQAQLEERRAAAENARRMAEVAAAQAARQQAVAVANFAMVQKQVWPDEQFEQWIFQQDRNAAGARQRLNSLLALQVDEIDRACQLTEAQRQKLQLIGRGDIKRFFDAFEKVRQKFKSLDNDVQKIQEIQPDVNPLRMTLQAGLFGEDSLLSKSLHNTLTDEQFAKYDGIVRERRAFRHRTNIERAVAMLEQGMSLRDAQRREFITLLMSETKPPRKSGQYDFYLIMFQLGR